MKSMLIAGLGLALAAASAEEAGAYTGQNLAVQAKVTLAHARTIALKARPGKIADQELEREKGGSGLRYSFDVKTRQGVWEVGVDARTGAVLENSKEGAHPD